MFKGVLQRVLRKRKLPLARAFITSRVASRNARFRSRDLRRKSMVPTGHETVYIPKSYLSEIEDRRLYHPEGVSRPFRALNRAVARLKAVDVKVHKKEKEKIIPRFIGFIDPARVLVCIRRKVRREVMHAMGAAGGSVRPPHRTESSEIRC